MPKKPYKWGYKLFVIWGISEYQYNFEIYSGQKNHISLKLSTESDIGTAGKFVIYICRVPRNVNHKIYFNNYYTSIKLMVH